MRFSHMAALLALPLALTACTENNTRLTVGDSVTLQTLSGDDEPAQPRLTARPDAPSLRRDSLARDHWPARDLDVPADRPEHQPAYRFNRDDPGLLDGTARQRAAYPTQLTALEAGSDESDADQALEALALPFYASAELVAIPAGMVIAPPSSVERSPEFRDRRFPPPMRMTDLLGPDADEFLAPARTFTTLNLRKLPPDAFIYIDGRWVPIPEAINPPPPAPPPVPSQAEPTAAAPAALGPSPAGPSTPSPAGQPTHYNGLPDDAFVFRDGHWMTVRAARALLSPAAAPAPPGAQP